MFHWWPCLHLVVWTFLKRLLVFWEKKPRILSLFSHKSSALSMWKLTTRQWCSWTVLYTRCGIGIQFKIVGPLFTFRHASTPFPKFWYPMSLEVALFSLLRKHVELLCCTISRHFTTHSKITNTIHSCGFDRSLLCVTPSNNHYHYSLAT